LFYESTKAENIPSENMIVGIYLHSPEQNLDMPCTAVATSTSKRLEKVGMLEEVLEDLACERAFKEGVERMVYI